MTGPSRAKWDAVLGSVPVDSVARRVTTPSPVQPPRDHLSGAESELPIAMRDASEAEVRSSGWLDLTGAKFGHMTVLGIAAGKSNPKRGRRWVVRCACGIYAIRYARSITNPANSDDGCGNCRDVNYKRNSARDLMLGKFRRGTP